MRSATGISKIGLCFFQASYILIFSLFLAPKVHAQLGGGYNEYSEEDISRGSELGKKSPHAVCKRQLWQLLVAFKCSRSVLLPTSRDGYIDIVDDAFLDGVCLLNDLLLFLQNLIDATCGRINVSKSLQVGKWSLQLAIAHPISSTISARVFMLEHCWLQPSFDPLYEGRRRRNLVAGQRWRPYKGSPGVLLQRSSLD